jgi:hypothetical protein
MISSLLFHVADPGHGPHSADVGGRPLAYIVAFYLLFALSDGRKEEIATP